MVKLGTDDVPCVVGRAKGDKVGVWGKEVRGGVSNDGQRLSKGSKRVVAGEGAVDPRSEGDGIANQSGKGPSRKREREEGKRTSFLHVLIELDGGTGLGGARVSGNV